MELSDFQAIDFNHNMLPIYHSLVGKIVKATSVEKYVPI
jgi:hypothetical protein